MESVLSSSNLPVALQLHVSVCLAKVQHVPPSQCEDPAGEDPATGI